jgi:hypothetical protein
MTDRPGFDRRLLPPMMLGSILNPINSTIISVALVPIGRALGAPASQTAWLVSGLYLATSLGQPVVGRLIDVFGPRRLFLLSLDYQVTVLSDACTDRNPALHDTLIAEVLARRGEVATVEEWAHTLKG